MEIIPCTAGVRPFAYHPSSDLIFIFSLAAVGVENCEKMDENSDKEMEEESPEKIKVLKYLK